MTGKMPRCSTCFLLDPICLCDEIKEISTKTKLILLMHRREYKKTTNSGRLASLALKNQELHIIGNKEKPIDWAAFYNQKYENLILFPDADALELSSDYIESLTKPIRLFVADGNWGQAKRMTRRIDNAGNFKKIVLPIGPPTEYRLRLAPEKPEGLSTLEAIARAYGILESKTVEQDLMLIFRMMVERNLFARGKITRDKVTGGIPHWP